MAHEFQKQLISDWHRSTLGSHITDNARDVDTRDFTPSPQSSDLHFQVDNLKPLLNELAKKGIQIEEQMVENDFGSFAWIQDPQGHRIELWEPAPWQNNLINLPEPD
ncbi:VOC family protein [Bdellovibrio bacteriovorus]|uniref:VOC family protein n=1 Tax=Bdellovibrio bacteriovorus TaxID=959 RepID=UPI003AA825DA